MHFHLPRRHRRKLLFPPGLLALAGLLWLGCVAVGVWREQLKPRYAIQLTMPLFPLNPSQSGQQSLLAQHFGVPNPGTICKSCSWYDASFTGSTIADKQEQAVITRYVHDVAVDTIHARGVRIHFMLTAKYASLVFVLNLLNEQDVKKYWLDITRKSITYYAITDVYKPKPNNDKMIELASIPMRCSLSNDVIYSQPKQSSMQLTQSLVDLRRFNWLRQPEWRASMWLLAAMAAHSGWRAVRDWRTA